MYSNGSLGTVYFGGCRGAESYFDEPFTVPEPSTLALFATGLIGLLAYAWRKRK